MDIEALASDARRRALVVVLRANPTWTIEQVLADDKHREQLESLTVRELCGHGQRAGLPPLPRTRYERATKLHGADFDSLALELLQELGRPVKSGQLRTRLGGAARWKVQGSDAAAVRSGGGCPGGDHERHHLPRGGDRGRGW